MYCTIVASGLEIIRRVDVYGREGQPRALFSVFTMRKKVNTSHVDEVVDTHFSSTTGHSREEVRIEVNDIREEGFIKNTEVVIIQNDLSSFTGYAGVDQLKSIPSISTTNNTDNVLSKYEVKILAVRRSTCRCHTSDYDEVMRAMGRPMSVCHCNVLNNGL